MLELAMDNEYSTNRNKHTLYVITYNRMVEYVKEGLKIIG